MGIMRAHEPMVQLRNQGIVLGEDSEKMSKSRGNVVAPDALVAHVRRGCRAGLPDVLRPLGHGRAVEQQRHRRGGALAAAGVVLFENRLRRRPASQSEASVESAAPQTAPDPALGHARFESSEFNTIVSGLMELLNEMLKRAQAGAAGTPGLGRGVDIYLKMLAPVAPHITEELWGTWASPIRSIPKPGRRWMKPPPVRMRSPWCCRSMARCATA
jgi:leucyl-tRNA synthetase